MFAKMFLSHLKDMGKIHDKMTKVQALKILDIKPAEQKNFKLIIKVP